MRQLFSLSLIFLGILLITGCSGTEAPESEAISWEELPELPNTVGLGGAFAGVSNGALIVAGGANFPNDPEWDNGS